MSYYKRLRMMAQNVDLDDANEAKRFIAQKQCAKAYKEGLVNSYVHYAREFKINLVSPKYKRAERFQLEGFWLFLNALDV